MQVRRVQLCGDQPALRDLGWHGARREDADAGTERYRFLDGLDIVEVHRQIDAGAIRREISRPFGALKETSRPSPDPPVRPRIPPSPDPPAGMPELVWRRLSGGRNPRV